MGKQKRILIVDDSATCRAGLKRILAADSDIVVAGEAGTGEQALELVKRTSPDLILMDILMPGIDGLKTTEKIMEMRPTPVLIVSDVVGRSVDLNFRALQAGALDVVSKPERNQFENQAVQKQFLRQIRLLSEIPVVTRRPGYGRPRVNPPGPEPEQPHPANRSVDLLAIGASTGGPPALQVLLSALDPNLLFPILVVQHMGVGFIAGLADWLSHATGRTVTLAKHGVRPEPGIIYLAPDGRHMEYFHRSIVLTGNNGLQRSHCPSVDVFFESIAKNDVVGNTIAVILTGMGSDGAAGLNQIRLSGGWTMAQDKASSVVFGMPQAAIQIGAVNEIASIERIGGRVNAISATMSGAVS